MTHPIVEHFNKNQLFDQKFNFNLATEEFLESIVNGCKSFDTENELLNALPATELILHETGQNTFGETPSIFVLYLGESNYVFGKFKYLKNFNDLTLIEQLRLVFSDVKMTNILSIMEHTLNEYREERDGTWNYSFSDWIFEVEAHAYGMGNHSYCSVKFFEPSFGIKDYVKNKKNSKVLTDPLA